VAGVVNHVVPEDPQERVKFVADIGAISPMIMVAWAVDQDPKEVADVLRVLRGLDPQAAGWALERLKNQAPALLDKVVDDVMPEEPQECAAFLAVIGHRHHKVVAFWATGEKQGPKAVAAVLTRLDNQETIAQIIGSLDERAPVKAIRVLGMTISTMLDDPQKLEDFLAVTSRLAPGVLTAWATDQNPKDLAATSPDLLNRVPVEALVAWAVDRDPEKEDAVKEVAAVLDKWENKQNVANFLNHLKVEVANLPDKSDLVDKVEKAME
jgi:hypothetical protein